MMTYHTRAPTLPDVSRRRKYLRIPDTLSVWRLALSISKRLGMTILDEKRLLDRLHENQITVYRKQDYTLWVDRHYIAVAPYAVDDVTYLYLTRHHITEELKTEHLLRKMRSTTALDSKARSQFQSALGAMNREMRDFAVRRCVVDDSIGDIDLKVPWT